MSKTIDRSDLSQLSSEELEYLRARGQLTPQEELQYLGDSTVSAPEGMPLEQRPNTGDVGPELDEEVVARRVEADRAGIVPGATPAAPGAPVNVFGAVPQASQEDRLRTSEDYDDASKKELRREIQLRQQEGRDIDSPPGNATKQDLIDALEEDDEG